MLFGGWRGRIQGGLYFYLFIHHISTLPFSPKGGRVFTNSIFRFLVQKGQAGIFNSLKGSPRYEKHHGEVAEDIETANLF